MISEHTDVPGTTSITGAVMSVLLKGIMNVYFDLVLGRIEIVPPFIVALPGTNGRRGTEKCGSLLWKEVPWVLIWHEH